MERRGKMGKGDDNGRDVGRQEGDELGERNMWVKKSGKCEGNRRRMAGGRGGEGKEKK